MPPFCRFQYGGRVCPRAARMAQKSGGKMTCFLSADFVLSFSGECHLFSNTWKVIAEDASNRFTPWQRLKSFHVEEISESFYTGLSDMVRWNAYSLCFKVQVIVSLKINKLGGDFLRVVCLSQPTIAVLVLLLKTFKTKGKFTRKSTRR